MPKISTIIFDLDNTLFDTDLLIYQSCFQEISRRISEGNLLSLSSQDVYLQLINLHKTNSSISLIDQFQKSLSVDEDTMSRISSIFEDVFKNFRPPHLYLYPGAWSTLEVLKSKYDLILLSEGEKDFQKWKIEKLKIKEFFSQIFIVPKGGKRSVLEALSNPKEIAVVGDRIGNELTIAKDLNMIPIAFSQGRHQEKRGENWYYRVKSTTQLPEILTQIESE